MPDNYASAPPDVETSGLVFDDEFEHQLEVVKQTPVKRRNYYLVAAGLFFAVTGGALAIHRHRQRELIDGIPRQVLDYHHSHPFNASLSSTTTGMGQEELEALIQQEEDEIYQLLDMTDKEIEEEGKNEMQHAHSLHDVFQQQQNTTEDSVSETSTDFNQTDLSSQGFWEDRRLQSGDGPVYHEPAPCPTPMGACTEITDVDRFLGVIPCNVCKRISTHRPIIDFPNGLLIQGKLEIMPTANVILKSTHIFVEGDLKVHLPLPGNEVIFRMYGTQEQTYTASPRCTNGCNMGSKAIAVVGGSVDIQGYPENCPAWEKLIGVFSFTGQVDTLLVSVAARECWGTPGTELLLTSHTRVDSDKQFAKVKSYNPATGLLTLEEPIVRPLTLIDSAEFAIEIASLNRRVKFEVDPSEPPTPIGGHFIVHNTARPQTLQGIEITGFGQQGILGKYPLHFHDCGASPNSVVSKNVIRDSNQRGYVIHLTDAVTISNNVAVDVIGHCYFLEAGTETFNNFIGNLGAGVKRMPQNSVDLLTLQSSRTGPESDHLASVFWISNPLNFFIGNVAAGCDIHGYWFDTEVLDINSEEFENSPAFLDNLAFVNNEVHSASHIAFTSYPPGWRPEGTNGLNVIMNLKVYRNNHWGAFLHVGQNMKFLNCVFADNGLRTVSINRADNLVFENCRFIAKTPYASTYPVCNQGMLGLMLHPSRFNEGVFNNAPDGQFKGSTLINTSFENYSAAGTGCANVLPSAEFVPMVFDTNQVFQNMYDSPHVFDGVTLDDPSQAVNSCPLYDEHGIENVNIEVTNDSSNTFSPTGSNGFLVSPKFAAMLPNPESCTVHKDCGLFPGTGYNPGGLDFCPNVCLRSFMVQANAAATANLRLVVLNLDTPKLMLVEGHTRGATNFFDRTFAAVLPKANYLFFFQNKSTMANVPKATVEASGGSVQVKLEAAPVSCSNYFAHGDYTWL